MNEQELIQHYGNPVFTRLDPGTGWCVPDVRWVNEHLDFVCARVDQQQTSRQWVLLHESIIQPWYTALASVDDLTWIKQIHGWAPRRKMLSPRRSLSLHAWGLAIDINPLENPYGSKVHNVPQDFVDAMTGQGFVWGGTWKTPDPMHFEMEAKT